MSAGSATSRPATSGRPRQQGGPATPVSPGHDRGIDRALGPLGETMPSDTLALADVLELSDLLLKSGKVRLRITSRSMVPALRPGDEIFVDPVPVETLQTGNLILFEHGGQLICHRLVQVFTNGTLTTQADAVAPGTQRGYRQVYEAQGRGGGYVATHCDEPITREQVLGRVRAIRRRTVWVGLKKTLQSALVPLLLRRLPLLQRVKVYRVLMRPIIAPFLSYHLGVAQGTRWHTWQRLDVNVGLPTLEPAPRPYLLLVKRGTDVVGGAFLVFKDSTWQCENVSVRMRYRGLGIESALARWAHLLFNGK